MIETAANDSIVYAFAAVFALGVVIGFGVATLLGAWAFLDKRWARAKRETPPSSTDSSAGSRDRSTQHPD